MSGIPIKYAWLVPALPLLGAIVAAAGGRWLKQRAHWPVILGIASACVVSLGLLPSAPSAREPAPVQPGTAGAREVSPGVEAGGHVMPLSVSLYRWIDAGDLHVPFELRLDGLSSMMIAMVTFVGAIIAVFAAGYMAGDPGYARFFAVVGLFVFSMTGLVLSNNYVVTYAFWEGVGVCSYLLIGFWYAKPSAAAAAQKAFLVNRIGDYGFAIALMWLWLVAPNHDLSYDTILNPGTIELIAPRARMGIALLMFWAATAKSAQIPLYVWLPDAMEGPTPVSALIHAATMVTAGVYLIARSSLLVMSEPLVVLLVAVVGCATALLSAAIAVTQTDLKRVLAYSTVSQLGFMFMGLGAGIGGVMQLAIAAAMFHLFTHAFFKALLFLGSGSVMHAMGGVIDVRRFRGLRRRLPITCATFAVGGLSLAGIAPLAGFWSKDEILAALKLAAHEAEAGGPTWGPAAYSAIYWIALLTAALTAFYTGRAFFLTFFGPEKLPSPDDPEAEPAEAHPHAHPAMPVVDVLAPETGQMASYEAAMRTAPAAEPHAPRAAESDPHRPADLPQPTSGASDEPVPQHGHGHDDHFGHESPPVMTIPLIVLAVGTVLVGMAFGPTHLFEHHVIGRTPGFDRLGHIEHGTDRASILLGTGAGLLGLALSYVLYAAPSTIPGRLARALGPLYRASYRKFGVDELYTALVVAPTWGLAWLSKVFDEYVVDGLVRLTAWVPRFVGRDLLAPLQGGLVQLYAWTTALGVVLLLLFLLFYQ